MNAHLLTVLFNLLIIMGGAMTLYGLYFAFVALFGFKKQPAFPAAQPRTRFAVVVAARNEEAVIGQLVDSLLEQHYPRTLFDVIVAPNNCTDDTGAVAEAHGAKLFLPKGKITGKGDVLKQLVDKLIQNGNYDAMCVFDADNLVHPDFLKAMNDAACAGAQVAQGFRDSKNPADTAVSTCYSVCYWMLNRFYNGGRQALGLSALVNGSGFMVSCPLLKELGGWNTHTMTEDYEFSAQCLLAGEKVQYIKEAIIYDEQPINFIQSWKQRRRWCTGSVQGMELYLAALLHNAVKKKSWASFDLAVTFMTPATQLFSLGLGLASAVLTGYRILEFQLIPLAYALALLALAALGLFLTCALLAAFVVRMNRRALQGTGKGIICFSLFLLSCLPITLISFFKKQTKWDAISHTRGISMKELRR